MISEKNPSQSLPLGSLGHGPQESPETNPNGEIVVSQVHNHTRPVSSSTRPSWMWKYSVFFKNINNYQSLLSNQPHLQSNLITISKILTNRKKTFETSFSPNKERNYHWLGRSLGLCSFVHHSLRSRALYGILTGTWQRPNWGHPPLPPWLGRWSSFSKGGTC